MKKKRKAIEHISNPNFKDRQLHIQDGLELDIHCKKIGKGTPFLTAYETLLRKEIENRKDLSVVDRYAQFIGPISYFTILFILFTYFYNLDATKALFLGSNFLN